MSKITKKQLHNGWHCHDMEIVKMKKELRELKRSVLRLEKLTDEKLPDEPPLKQLDQSIFDGLDTKWRFAAVCERKELTGSDLCRAMLERGDNYIMCRVGLIKQVVIINKFEGGWFYSEGVRHADPAPINNKGEPLTASEVGL